MESNNDVIIVGGGIIGLACAHYLIKENVSVRIIEQDLIGSGASHGNCGLLYFSGVIPLCSPGVVRHEIYRTILGTSSLYIKPTLDIPLIAWLIKFAAHCNATHMNAASKAKNKILRYSLDLFETLFSKHAIECNFEKKGTLFLFKNKKYFEQYKSTNAFLENFGFGAKALDRDEALQLEPAITKDIAGAWYNEHDWHLRPEMLVDSWKKLLIKKGLIIEEKSKMIDFEIKQGKIRHVNTVTGQYKADAFILATGAWAPEIKKQLKLTLPIQPGKGYSITMERPDQSCKIPCYFYEKNIVATPWKTGYRLGGTMEFSGFTDVLNKKRLSRLVSGAKEYLNTPVGRPALEEWTGLRPMTYDDLPIIDRSPFQNNLFIATGHGMLGLTLATGTGKAISDMICNGNAQINLAPFSMDRF
ncbi:MAG: FAD-binding oxidoreductase [Desulfobacula sp.]|uniref:NAD(P)/FAD-dependent oxidoreductase n=1 Tax=Desulfobacula sp. TaxID=2593537 RepID=UPI0025B91D31|nr:FAD-dependent oxidoreductase [Desulfobacula sp.]MCD4721418.1 FAD-binding oxidoreductase [Desulfobacula sp.]